MRKILSAIQAEFPRRACPLAKGLSPSQHFARAVVFVSKMRILCVKFLAHLEQYSVQTRTWIKNRDSAVGARGERHKTFTFW